MPATCRLRCDQASAASPRADDRSSAHRCGGHYRVPCSPMVRIAKFGGPCLPNTVMLPRKLLVWSRSSSLVRTLSRECSLQAALSRSLWCQATHSRVARVTSPTRCHGLSPVDELTLVQEFTASPPHAPAPARRSTRTKLSFCAGPATAIGGSEVAPDSALGFAVAAGACSAAVSWCSPTLGWCAGLSGVWAC